jgi:hypothetical protein
MLLLAAIAAIATTPAERPVEAQATVRIERPVSASADQWERLSETKRREILVRDEHGRPVLVRLIENE